MRYVKAFGCKRPLDCDSKLRLANPSLKNLAVLGCFNSLGLPRLGHAPSLGMTATEGQQTEVQQSYGELHSDDLITER